MSIATPAFFWSLFAWNIFFQPFTFSLYVSPVLRWVYCRQHIQGSCFCIHSASLCLLIGAFNPFRFMVIIDMYDPVAIYFIVLGSSLYSLFLFPFYRRSFNICWRAGLVVLNSLSFCLPVKLLIFPSYLNEILAGYSNLGFSLSSLKYVLPFPSGLEEFLLKDQLLSIWESPCVLFVVFPLLLLIFVLCV